LAQKTNIGFIVAFDSKFNPLFQNLTHKITIWRIKTDITLLFYFIMLLLNLSRIRLLY